MGTQFSQIGGMVQGKVPYDAKIAADSAAAVEVIAKLPWVAFGEGTDKGDTKAKPEIWSEGAKFKEAQDKLIAETAKLAAASKTGKLEDLKVAFAATGGACKNCHDSFRAK
jgi:cytochrome c556